MIDLSLPQLSQRVATLEQKVASPLNWRGAYDAKLIYKPNDVVTSGGSTYVCIKAGFNQAPASSPTYWLRMPGTASGSVPGTFLGTDIYGNQGMFSPPQVSGAYNGTFEEGRTDTLSIGTAYTQVLPGWFLRKINAGDTLACQRLVPGVDSPHGGSAALWINKTGTAGKADLLQGLIPRLVGAYANRPVTIVARIWSTAVGFVRCQYTDGSSTTYGAFNTTASTFETITLTVNVGAVNFLQFGVDLAALAGTLYVIDCEIFVGATAPILASPTPPGNSQAAAPKCLKSFGLNNNFTLPGGSAAYTLPFTSSEQDTDGMASGNGVVIRTPGRYFIACSILIYTWTIAGYYVRISLQRNGGFLNVNTVYGSFTSGTHISGTSYPSIQVVAVDDLALGDSITAFGAFDYPTAAQSVGIYFNVTQFFIARIGD